jgi:hypothetical protein
VTPVVGADPTLEGTRTDALGLDTAEDTLLNKNRDEGGTL